MPKTALITGGTGGLGAAVTARLLDDGWRVVVPWIAESEFERVEPRDGLTLVRADLFDAQDAAGVVNKAASEADAPLRAVVELVGGFDAPGKIDGVALERFEEQFRLNLRATYL